MDFYPRPPRGGRPAFRDVALINGLFLSTPSARRATAAKAGEAVGQLFLSTPSARRATPWRGSKQAARDPISIHALREEGDSTSSGPINRGRPFLSTPSARRATQAIIDRCNGKCISIHALREEGDFFNAIFQPPPTSHFYPRPPRGGRRDPRSLAAEAGRFLSTPSARRATATGT